MSYENGAFLPRGQRHCYAFCALGAAAFRYGREVTTSRGRRLGERSADVSGAPLYVARAVGADASALARLLRALASLGVLAEPLPQQSVLTPISELLRRDVPGSMRDWLIAETDPPHWQAWGQLHEAVRSGRTVVFLFGMHIYDYYAAHPADLAYFSRAMGNVSALVAGGTVQHGLLDALENLGCPRSARLELVSARAVFWVEKPRGPIPV